LRSAFTDSFAAAVADIRQKLVEEGWFGKAVTGRRQTISIDSPEEQSPGEQLGWWPHDSRTRESSTPDHDRGAAAKEPNTPDRGIDL
jgi:hypothetical protein